jgi:3-oxoadipate enol-lactonase
VSDIKTIYIGEKPRIAVDVAGAGPLVMFLHGNGFSRLDWHDQIRDFAPHFTAAAWDARGHAGSDDYDGPYRFGDVCDDLVRVLDHLGSERTHLVGHSMGGRVVLEFQNRFPDRVKSVTFAGTSAKREPRLSDEELSIRRARRVTPLKNGADLRQIALDNTRRYLAKGASAKVFEAVSERLANVRRDSYAKTLETVVSYTDFPEYSTVTAPCLVLTGAEDPQATPEYARAVTSQIKGAKLVLIPNAGHMVNMEQSAAFSAAVLDFIRHCECEGE